jgi:hypothetical protein
MIRLAGAPPLATLRSLAYFLPAIEEVLTSPVSPNYFRYLRQKLERLSRLPDVGGRPGAAGWGHYDASPPIAPSRSPAQRVLRPGPITVRNSNQRSARLQRGGAAIHCLPRR